MPTPHGMFTQPIAVRWPVRLGLALSMLVGSGLFGLGSYALLTGDRSQFPHPDAVLAVAFVFAALAACCGFIGIRLLRIRIATDYIFTPGFSRKAAVVILPCLFAFGALKIVAGVLIDQSQFIASGVIVVVLSALIYVIDRNRRTR